MAPRKGSGRRSAASPTRDRGGIVSHGLDPSPTTTPLRASAAVLDRTALIPAAQEDDFGDPPPDSGGGWSTTNPRSFPYSVKQQCWEKAEKVSGRDPDRWRRDPLGNLVFRKLVGCPGCLCHDYDHVLPYSKGGRSTIENCQVLQATVNRSKGNRTELSRSDLRQKSAYCKVSGRDMDLLEVSAYGSVRRGPDTGGCNIQ